MRMRQLAVGVALSDRPCVASSCVSLNHVGCMKGCGIMVSAIRRQRRLGHDGCIRLNISLHGRLMPDNAQRYAAPMHTLGISYLGKSGLL